MSNSFFSCKSFIFSDFIYLSLIYFEFIFVYGIGFYFNFILSHVAVESSHHYLLKRVYSPLYIVALFVID